MPDSSNNQTLTESLFPNPTAGPLNVVFNNAVEGAQLSITDNQGRQVLAQTISGTTIPIDISRLPQGNYIVTIKTGTYSFRDVVVRQ
jgi:hypothetical protein